MNQSVNLEFSYLKKFFSEPIEIEKVIENIIKKIFKEKCLYGTTIPETEETEKKTEYIDLQSFRLAEGFREEPNGDKKWFWSKESVVRLEPPSLEEARQNLDIFFEVAKLATTVHRAESSPLQWESLLENVHRCDVCHVSVGLEHIFRGRCVNP